MTSSHRRRRRSSLAGRARGRTGPEAVDALSRLIRRARSDPGRQLRISLLFLGGLIIVGAVGYRLIERLRWVEAVYMTVITLTTVGFGEVHPLSDSGRVFTIGLIVLGVGISAWAVSSAAEVMLGEAFWTSFQRRRIRVQVTEMRDHYVVCGYGRLGRQIVRDLDLRGEPYLVVDIDAGLEEELLEKRVPHLIADASLDETLREVGIDRARGLVACADSDATNVLMILTAREMNPRLLIVARANNESVEAKLRRAGADRMVTPEAIGGHRLALALLRPAVHDFFTHVFSFGFGAENDVDIGQVTIQANSTFHGQTVAKCDLRRVRNVSILAVRTPAGAFDMTPSPDRVLSAGETLILIGPAEAIYELEAMYSPEPA